MAALILIVKRSELYDEKGDKYFDNETQFVNLKLDERNYIRNKNLYRTRSPLLITASLQDFVGPGLLIRFGRVLLFLLAHVAEMGRIAHPHVPGHEQLSVE